MPQLTVTNTRADEISFLGLGKIQPKSSKSGYVEEALYATHATQYKTKAANTGVVVLPADGDVPDNVQIASSVTTQVAGTKVALLDSTSGTFAYTLVAADSVASGVRIAIFNEGSANQVTVTADGADTVDGGATYALTFGNRVELESDGVSAWTIV